MESDDQALHQACSALWLATLSLMTAFMQILAPAHRYQLARRIALNFATLCEQECFATPTRTTFAKLAAHWRGTADQLAPRSRDTAPTHGTALL